MNGFSKEPEGNEANTLLPAVRPAMASEALQLLKEGKEIDIHNETVFELMRYFKKAERNLKLRFRFNRDNEGWTVVCPNCC